MLYLLRKVSKRLQRIPGIKIILFLTFGLLFFTFGKGNTVVLEKCLNIPNIKSYMVCARKLYITMKLGK